MKIDIVDFGPYFSQSELRGEVVIQFLHQCGPLSFIVWRVFSLPTYSQSRLSVARGEATFLKRPSRGGQVQHQKVSLFYLPQA
eukprot:1149594-Pelagomonas_calceolata.AAC.1